MRKLILFLIFFLTLTMAAFYPIAGYAGSEVSPPCQVCNHWQYGLQIESINGVKSFICGSKSFPP